MAELHGVPASEQDSPDQADFPTMLKDATMPGSRSFWIGAVIGGVLAIATALLIIQNGDTADLRWLMLEFTAPMWLFLLASALSGAVLALLALPLWRRARSRAARRREATAELGRLAEPEEPSQAEAPGAERDSKSGSESA